MVPQGSLQPEPSRLFPKGQQEISLLLFPQPDVEHWSLQPAPQTLLFLLAPGSGGPSLSPHGPDLSVECLGAGGGEFRCFKVVLLVRQSAAASEAGREISAHPEPSKSLPEPFPSLFRAFPGAPSGAFPELFQGHSRSPSRAFPEPFQSPPRALPGSHPQVRQSQTWGYLGPNLQWELGTPLNILSLWVLIVLLLEEQFKSTPPGSPGVTAVMGGTLSRTLTPTWAAGRAGELQTQEKSPQQPHNPSPGRLHCSQVKIKPSQARNGRNKV